ncbi:hypothetical protein [Bradyrhizobium sp. USDA 4508]
MSEQIESLLSDEERLCAVRIFNAVEVLYSMNRRITYQLVLTFLRVANEEHQTVTSLAVKCRIEADVMTRHLQDLGAVNRHGQPGLGLIEMVDGLYDRRERRAILTERGVQAARLIYEALIEPEPVPRRPKDRVSPA